MKRGRNFCCFLPENFADIRDSRSYTFHVDFRCLGGQLTTERDDCAHPAAAAVFVLVPLSLSVVRNRSIDYFIFLLNLNFFFLG